MTYAYPQGTGTAPYRSSHRNHYVDPPSPLERMWDSLPPWVRQWAAELRTRGFSSSFVAGTRSRSRGEYRSLVWRMVRRIFTIANGLIVLWIFTLWWGERTVFRDSLESCLWQNWEKWPQGATPHHIAFVADPQLVDPHTYPGRPWPLSTLTVKYTDQYLRRSFSLIQQNLAPDSVLFLGDLFDGGREWARGQYSSPEKRYKGYKDSFWKQEFGRFVRIFSDHFNDGVSHSTNPRGRKMLAGLPGNHDLGFGTGIQEPVRQRFQAFFGKGNRVDVIGNHTFVSVDTVSLSAMDQPDPVTGSTGAGLGDGHQPNERIWKDTEEFLNNMNRHRGKAEAEELRVLRNQSEGLRFQYQVFDNVLEPSIYENPQPDIVGFPAVLLTHVPLYRKPATPCGPLREHYPPSSPNEELEQDEQNALKIQGGYQYQNVLTQTISNDLISKVGPNLIQVYSGDDHDYCEISHREFSGSPKEITVKSLSWAMGVRRPGFLLTSLWNPIDPDTAKSIETSSSPITLQNHLCLLPDQLSIFIQYGCLFAFCTLVLFIRAVALAFHPPTEQNSPGPVLPLSEHRPYPSSSKTSTSSTSSSTMSSPAGLASRTMNPTPRYAPAKLHHDAYPALGQNDEYSDGSKWKSRRAGSPGSPVDLIRREFTSSIKHVAMVVFAWYFFLIWTW